MTLFENLAERGLAMQGFPSNRSTRRIRPWLRMTPSLSTLFITAGTALRSPALLFGFALVSALGASQRRHPFDRVYNRFIHTRGLLPETPAPRRFAMGMASVWAAAAALLMLSGRRRAGTVAGGLLGAAGASVATTNQCLGSAIYRQLERLR